MSVRLEAVRAAMKLKIRDEKIVSELIRLTEFDPAWKIKAYAIKGELLVLFQTTLLYFAVASIYWLSLLVF